MSMVPLRHRSEMHLLRFLPLRRIVLGPNLEFATETPEELDATLSSVSGSAGCAIFHLQDTPSKSQSPPPGFGEKRLALSGLPFHSSASGGGSRFTVMFGHT